MRLVLIALNPTVGDVEGNARLIEEGLATARRQGADLVVFPELAVCGYPPRDLLLEGAFIEACGRAVANLTRLTADGPAAVIGFPRPVPGGLANSLVLAAGGRQAALYDKRLLPTYDVFDEHRYFRPGDLPVVAEIAGRRVGLSICEDLWKGEDAGFAARYREGSDPVADLAARGAEIVVSPSASPFVLGKQRRHQRILAAHARRHRVTMVSVNQLGGNDDLVFDGRLSVYAPGGACVAGSRAFDSEPLVVELPAVADDTPGAEEEGDLDLELFKALRLGIADYLRKTGFDKALIGLSGGIDSAVTAALAVAALGPGRVRGVALPGKYSSEHSLRDAEELARRLGIAYQVIPISAAFEGFRELLDAAFRENGEARLGERLPDLAEENLQARVRGTVLMALSNRSGAIVLTTGNKSELAVGYCTLYGDMNGGLAVLSDVAKTQVYRLARLLDARPSECGLAGPPIPESTITKPPSAELAPDQRDSDSLPPYDVLDEIVQRYVEDRHSAATIAEATGFDPELVGRIVRLITRNEYKRKQAAIGLKVTSVAFGRGRRMPIAQGWTR
ncbi:MAG: NAD+ synthase [Acidobacteriota bacterium]|nr:NAD+ synthase [Acidobacteriota bacterium]MDQ7087851.1 NAD+ synthase [Acidobacteriota bacterium]